MTFKNFITSLLYFCIMTAGLYSCSSAHCSDRLTDDEIALINDSDSLMRVLTTENSADIEVLRAKSKDFSAYDLLSEEYKTLCDKLIITVTHPSQDGVGIAAPQVGLNRRVVAVLRYDKDGYPFEIYPNIRIIRASEEKALGSEGCLSVPDRSGQVLRSTEVVIEYADLDALRQFPTNKIEKMSIEDIPTIQETINGFTAVIFQHETDHLEGTLYIDLLQECEQIQ